MIRPATSDDIPELMRMGRAFHAVTGVADIIPLDDASLEQTFANLIAAPTGVILVADNGAGLAGAVGALLHAHYFNAAHVTGQELFWWVDPAQRGFGSDLFNALEAWVRENEAATFSMIALDSLDAERVGRIYRRHGYRPTEHSWMKRF